MTMEGARRGSRTREWIRRHAHPGAHSSTEVAQVSGTERRFALRRYKPRAHDVFMCASLWVNWLARQPQKRQPVR